MRATSGTGPAGEASPPLRVEELLDPAAYPHPVAAPRLIETNTSRIVLTGDYAYKLKKPVRFEFLDASTLARRHPRGADPPGAAGGRVRGDSAAAG